MQMAAYELLFSDWSSDLCSSDLDLTRDEITALLDAPDPQSRLGTRDRAMLHLAYAGGLRVAELLSLQMQDFPERSLATVHIIGKGRRERVLPLWRETQAALRAWLAVRPQCHALEIFLNANDETMSRDGFAFRERKSTRPNSSHY